MAYDSTGDTRVGQLRSQVAEVKEVMSDNVNKVLERGEKVDGISKKAEILDKSARDFRKTTRRMMWQKRCSNMKLWIILITIIVILILAIVLIVAIPVIVVVTKDN